jgi:septal ring factor EnvC (AmiA/AmiB activator)
MLTLIPNPDMHGGASEAQWSERFRALHERQRRLEAFLAEGTLTDESRARELEGRSEELSSEIDALEQEADRAEVPAAWRE